MSKRYGKEVREEALEMLKAGHSSIYTGKLLGIKPSTVRSWKRAERKKEEARIGPEGKLKRDISDRIYRLLAQIDKGIGVIEIATPKELKDVIGALNVLTDTLRKLQIDERMGGKMNNPKDTPKRQAEELVKKMSDEELKEVVRKNEEANALEIVKSGKVMLEDLRDYSEGRKVLRERFPAIPHISGSLYDRVRQLLREKKEPQEGLDEEL